MATFLPQNAFNSAGINVTEYMFPSSLTYSHGFTTFPNVDHPTIQYCPLSDNALNVHAVFGRTAHPVLAMADGLYPNQVAWEASYPAGSINPSNTIVGGFGFYLSGPTYFGDLLSVPGLAQEVVFGYSVMFEEGWEWAKGGKMPGICESFLISERFTFLTRRSWWDWKFSVWLHGRTK